MQGSSINSKAWISERSAPDFKAKAFWSGPPEPVWVVHPAGRWFFRRQAKGLQIANQASKAEVLERVDPIERDLGGR
jgi:hypothetical protein